MRLWHFERDESWMRPVLLEGTRRDKNERQEEKGEDLEEVGRRRQDIYCKSKDELEHRDGYELGRDPFRFAHNFSNLWHLTFYLNAMPSCRWMWWRRRRFGGRQGGAREVKVEGGPCSGIGATVEFEWGIDMRMDVVKVSRERAWVILVICSEVASGQSTRVGS